MYDLDAPAIPILSRHFAFQAICISYYRWRDVDDFAIGGAIEACEKSLAISKLAAEAFIIEEKFDIIPSHHCFKQYAIIEEKRGNFAKAILLTRQAKAEGWQGDWDSRLVRLSHKMGKPV
ncbi:hypothetical protein DFR47_11019 [Pseudochrobactrum asaccharolyticum]|uniref:Uncharacterized protein n=2 Tax=Pseudochrobactrum asaccharolyticum TaxID=354351 RepID=A0A366DLR5_9HYPH|nr:hypothetical protein DFR47_11019 [Pseudochrobactrum asaccharolyticum]